MTITPNMTSRQPMDLKLNRDNTLFVVMDVQERLVDAMPDECRSVAVDNVIRLVQGARILNLPLMVTEQYPQGLGRTIDSVAQALRELDPVPSPIAKLEFDGCSDDRFLASITERSHFRAGETSSPVTVVLFGMEVHV